MGPDGAGKPTLLLMLASLVAPDAATIRVGEVDPMSDPLSARRLLGCRPDALCAWSSLTARETIVTTARLYDIDPVDAQQRAGELLALVGLDDLADAPAKVLSRGQKQKLGLARALVHDPQVLLLDEPASGPDTAARRRAAHRRCRWSRPVSPLPSSLRRGAERMNLTHTGIIARVELTQRLRSVGIQLVIAGGLFAGAWARTRTPARMLPQGTRIA